MAEVELPNLKELEEARDKAFSRRVALTTAVYAVALAIASLGGSNAMKEMLLAQQEASNQWAFYQSKVIREHLNRGNKMVLETQLAEPSTLKGAEREKFEALARKFADEEKRMNVDKKEIEPKAKAAEAVRDRNQAKDPYFDYAEVLLQIAIVTRLDLDPVRLAPDLRLLAGPGRPRRPAVGERLHPARPPPVLPRVLTRALAAATRPPASPLRCFSGVV